MSHYEEYFQQLQRILAEIREGISDDVKVGIRERLNKYNSELPTGPEYTLLYDMADAANSDLGKQITVSTIGRLRDRTALLSYEVGILRAVARKAEADAAVISLKKIQLVATAVKEIADSINAAWKLIDESKLAEAGPLLQKALDRVVQLPQDITQ